MPNIGERVYPIMDNMSIVQGILTLITRNEEHLTIKINEMELNNTRDLTAIFRTGRLSGHQTTYTVSNIEIDGESREKFINGCGDSSGAQRSYYKLELNIIAPLDEGNDQNNGYTRVYFPRVAFNGGIDPYSHKYCVTTMTLSQPDRFNEYKAIWVGLPDDEDES